LLKKKSVYIISQTEIPCQLIFYSYYYASEYMPGGNLYDFLHKKNITLELSVILRIAIGISRGMDYLHQNNIIHRDLKTANLLIGNGQVCIFLRSYLLFNLILLNCSNSFLKIGCEDCRFWCLSSPITRGRHDC
jgi:serine/threonine protein kinase